MTSHPTNSEPTGLERDLVAYLDGEMSAEEAQRVERLMAEDAGVRRDVQHMQRAWDLLDALPRTEVGSNFTQSTVSLVALQIEKDVLALGTAERTGRRWRWVAAAVALVAASVAGFVAVEHYWPDPDDQLLRDLTVLESLDEYRQAGDVEFLRGLHEEGVFAEEEEGE